MGLTYHLDPEYQYDGRVPAEARRALITDRQALEMARGNKSYWRCDNRRARKKIQAGDTSEKVAVDRRFAASMWWVHHKKLWDARRRIERELNAPLLGQLTGAAAE